MRKSLVLLPLLAVLAACGQAGTNVGGYVSGMSGDGRVTEYAAADRAAPIKLTGKTLDGKTLDLASSRGKVTVLNIWWTGCGPCRQEMPMLQAAYEAEGKDVAFIGLNTRDSSAEQGLAFERHYGVTYPSFYSPNGDAVLALKGELAPRTIPATAILDKQGRVSALIRGSIPSARTLDELIQSAGKA